MNKLIIFANLLTCLNIHAEERPCGEYSVVARVEMQEGFPVLLINPKTKSQITLTTIHSERPKLSPYLDRNLKAKITIHEAFDKTHGKFDLIEDLESGIPDPLSTSSGTSLSLIKSADCKKTK